MADHLVDPFIVVRNDDEKRIDPEEKQYLLLLVWYEDEEDEPQNIYDIFRGRTAARDFIIANISKIDPHESRVIVDGTKNLSLDSVPTVYQLFTDPRSSWNDPNIFPDGFNIDQEMEVKDSINTAYEEDRIPGTSPMSADVVDVIMSADGIELGGETNGD